MDVALLSLPALDLASYRPNTFRGQSLPHESEIRDWLDERLGITRKSGGRGYEGWEAAGSIGFFFEDAMGKALAEYAGQRLGLIPSVELEKDGILLSPDRLHPDTMEPWDFKFTWKSVKKNPPEAIWRWQVQFRSYALALGVRSAVVVALYCCGDYAPPQPRLVVQRMTYTEQELEENWIMIVNGKLAMEKEKGL